MVLFHSEAIKSVTLEPDRSRPSSVKCVGHFGSVRAGGTQSNCSLKAKCDGASLSPLHQIGSTSSPKQSEGEGRGGGGRWWRRMKEERKREWEEGWRKSKRRKERSDGSEGEIQHEREREREG